MNSGFVVGAVLVGHHLNIAGASHYPCFGRIEKITKGGAFRVVFLMKQDVVNDKNSSGEWGSRQQVKPTDVSRSDSALARFNGNDEDEDKVDCLWSKDYSWDLYDASKEYFDDHDNGD